MCIIVYGHMRPPFVNLDRQHNYTKGFFIFKNYPAEVWRANKNTGGFSIMTSKYEEIYEDYLKIELKFKKYCEINSLNYHNTQTWIYHFRKKKNQKIKD